MCLIDDLNAVSFANDLCNRYGVDTISTGVAIAFAMEAYEKGLITKEDTGASNSNGAAPRRCWPWSIRSGRAKRSGRCWVRA